MKTVTCRVCRSVNHGDAIRCLNCGSPIELVMPEGMSSDDLPPPPAAPPVPAGWNAALVDGGKPRPLTASAIVAAFLAVGLIITFGVVVFVLRFQTPLLTIGGEEVTLASLLGPVLTTIVGISFAFQVWMLVDVVLSGADLGSKVLWALLILFLGLPGAIAYLLMGRPRRRTRF
jgi:hypothetical protein